MAERLKVEVMNELEVKHRAIPQLRLLRDSQMEEIHGATLEVLERTGVMIQHESARALLLDAGCTDGGGEVIRFPARLVEDCIKQAPSNIPVFDANGNLSMELGDRRSYFGAGGSCPYLLDSDGRRRPFTLQDARNLAVVADACDQLSFTMTMCHSNDVPVSVRDICEISETILTSPKPIIITANDNANLRSVLEIFRIISDGAKGLEKKPFIIYYAEPISPLKHSTHSLGKLMIAVEAGLPVLNTPAPMAGATGPVTLAGNIVVGNAELLSGLVLVQRIRPGSPFIYGGVFSTLDMANMIMPYGSPELHLQTAATAEMARYYELPSFGTAGCTDAHCFDPQAGFEAGVSILSNILSGANLIHDVGWLEFANTVSLEMTVACNEMIGWARRFVDGISLDKEALATELIAEVGIGGSFLDTDLTLSRYRSEQWFGSKFNRQRHDIWVSQGRTTYSDRLGERVKAILSEHRPRSIGEEKSEAIRRFVSEVCEEKW
jgi:trimethylamine---corrinoid protein Co-methyltransferase